MSNLQMSREIDIKNITGLTEAEAERRLAEDGYNELPSTRRRSVFAIAFEVAREPMFLLLVACGAIYLALGDMREALMLLGFVFVIMGITLYQERKTERALEALRDLSSPRALVIRDGAERRIAGREVVRGDVLVIKEGDRIPADAVLLSCLNLAVDESLLTGEAAPVRKSEAQGHEKICRPGGDDLPFIYSGTLAVQGQGVARALAIGAKSETGKIGRALQTIEQEETLLQKETRRMARNLGIIGLSLCVLVIVIYGITRGNWLHGFLAGIALAMAILPEELPVVLTIFLALGAWRISKNRVLTRRIPAVEALGSATALCVDKTGTITMNSMSVTRMFADGEFYNVKGAERSSLPETFHELLEFSVLSSQIDPFDPMEKAIKRLGNTFLADTEHLHKDWDLVREYPLSRRLLSLSRIWKSPDGSDFIIAAKGSPEAIADLCHFDDEQNAEVSKRIAAMADDGLRVLGVAKARFGKPVLPGGQHDFAFEFLGLIGLTDPVRPAVPDAVKECYSAGIRVMMITGDYPGTARNVALQIGLVPADRIITGSELENMSDIELRQEIRETNIFARVVPEQKLRLVNALKANGEIVAMTGDGVNDAPALKSAQIGIAMGGRGTDVARESAELVLLDDDFSSIAQAVKLGRRIFDNITKAFAYILAIHVPIAGISLIPALFKLPLVLMPVHIVFLELIIDPACSIVFESVPEEPDVMNRPPRNPSKPLFNKWILTISLIQGAAVLFIILIVFYLSILRGHNEEETRALTFTTLMIANLCLILTNLSWTRSIFYNLRSSGKALLLVISGAVILLGMVLYVPFLRDLFRFDVLHAIDIWICLGAGILGILWFEALKFFGRSKIIR